MVAMLSRDVILVGALEVIDRGSPEDLTMRALADQLGVSATAIYRYFESRDAVLAGVVDRLCADMVSAVSTSGRWRVQVLELLTAMTERMLEHPRLAIWSIAEYGHRPPVRQLHDRIVEVLVAAGFSPDGADRAKGALLRFCIGHVVLEMERGESFVSSTPGERLESGLALIIGSLRPPG